MGRCNDPALHQNLYSFFFKKSLFSKVDASSGGKVISLHQARTCTVTMFPGISLLWDNEFGIRLSSTFQSSAQSFYLSR